MSGNSNWLDELKVGDEVIVEGAGFEPALATVSFITPARQRISAGNATFSGKTGIELAQPPHVARHLSFIPSNDQPPSL